MRTRTYRAIQSAISVSLSLGVVSAAQAAVFPEVEPNDTKATPNLVGPMVAGDSITGMSTGSSTTVAGIGSADNFLVRTAPLPLGIYEHRLVITTNGLAGHTGTLRGSTVTAATAAPPDTLPGTPWDGVIGAPAPNTDAVLQTSSTLTTPPRYNQWYGFGRGEAINYRVTGTTNTTVDYAATLETRPITPQVIGVYQPGLITISTFAQGHSSDTDFWVYDGSFNAMPGHGNDDESPLGGTPGTGVTLQGWLARDFAPGTYYIAMTNFNLANDQPSPSDDDFRTGSVHDFPDAVSNSSTTVNLNMTFTITDSAGTFLQVPNTKLSQYDVNWFCFTVVPEPGSMALLALAAPALLRRRK